MLDHNNATRFCLLVSLREGRPIGFFNVAVDAHHRCAETAVLIGKRAQWGRNVVIEVRCALLDLLFAEMEMHKVIGQPHGRNFASLFD